MIVVFGSINLDLIFPLPVLPGSGETVLAPAARIEPGGKGANQALAASRDGAVVAMAGAVYGGSMMAQAGKRHNLRFALLLLVFAVELILFLVGEAVGKPKGVTWLLAGAILAGLAVWAKLKQDRLFASVAEMTADLDG